MRYVRVTAAAALAILMIGCASPGKIAFEVERSNCGDGCEEVAYRYSSTKDVDLMIETPDGQKLSVRSSATAPITAMGDAVEKNADSINRLIRVLPAIPAAAAGVVAPQ